MLTFDCWTKVLNKFLLLTWWWRQRECWRIPRHAQYPPWINLVFVNLILSCSLVSSQNIQQFLETLLETKNITVMVDSQKTTKVNSDSSSGDHECLHKTVRQFIQKLFWWFSCGAMTLSRCELDSKLRQSVKIHLLFFKSVCLSTDSYWHEEKNHRIKSNW